MDFHEPFLVELQEITHPSGTITVAENGTQVPFLFERVYFIHRLGRDSQRGAHAHVRLKQVIIAIKGSFRVDLEGLTGRTSFFLERPSQGLLVPPLTWRDLGDFSDDAICLVLASNRYEEQDYIRDYDDFRALSRDLAENASHGRWEGNPNR